MSGDMAIQIGRDALAMVMLVSAPMLGLGLIVGVLVSIFQATTQIQEQSLAFIPKIIAVFFAVLIFGPWMLKILTDYTRDIFISLPNLIK
ncbi:MAG TPA: flagellar biosynthesis protein FliQ [Methylomusa anaerophila]|uniref:Flagellar biosynthetic protein FliQ n=1 Tax=Methylomusa anaerophila TaxID=1930071 RepID=A0A348AQ23_9FIRM|nr:flagellar biosynthesis protein FliQ [Methylomusa anaerophila]BBB93171.1 flagellar biosynthetic protein FliQ [Methylomusa anaerophila]HML86997.1 flagellar biosynthesis protein FliQ [Methylomusa anaerophila]